MIRLSELASGHADRREVQGPLEEALGICRLLMSQGAGNSAVISLLAHGLSIQVHEAEDQDLRERNLKEAYELYQRPRPLTRL